MEQVSPGTHSVLCECRERSGTISWPPLHDPSPGHRQKQTHQAVRKQKIERFSSFWNFQEEAAPRLRKGWFHICRLAGCRTPPCSQTGAGACLASAPGRPSQRCRESLARLAPEGAWTLRKTSSRLSPRNSELRPSKLSAIYPPDSAFKFRKGIVWIFFYNIHNQRNFVTRARQRTGVVALFISVYAFGEGPFHLVCTFALRFLLSTLAPSKARHLAPEHFSPAAEFQRCFVPFLLFSSRREATWEISGTQIHYHFKTVQVKRLAKKNCANSWLMSLRRKHLQSCDVGRNEA